MLRPAPDSSGNRVGADSRGMLMKTEMPDARVKKNVIFALLCFTPCTLWLYSPLRLCDFVVQENECCIN